MMKIASLAMMWRVEGSTEPIVEGHGHSQPTISHTDTIPGYLAKYGIDVEQHNVTTDDGYILGVFRLPRPGAPVVFLQHGILDSSWSFFDNSPEIALGFQLHGLGYDIWLGNDRGNMFSRGHVSMNPKLNKEFWSFSFSEMGKFDVPANIDYVLNQTGKASLSYVGHSQGTSQFFVAMTQPNLRTKLESKVNAFIALAPVAYMAHQKVLLYEVMGHLGLTKKMKSLYPYGFLDADGVSAFGNTMCKLTGGLICKFGVNIACGTSSKDTTQAILNITAHFPYGTSVQSVDHFEQLYLAGKFQDYDYGSSVNLEKYGEKVPPEYDLSQAAKVPTALFIGSKDKLGDPKDVATLQPQLPNVVYSKTFNTFSHITWIAGSASAFQEWYPDLESLLSKYNPLSTVVV